MRNASVARSVTHVYLIITVRMLYIVQLSLNNLSCAYASLVMLKSSFTDIMQEYKALCAEVSSADSTSWTHEHTLETLKRTCHLGALLSEGLLGVEIMYKAIVDRQNALLSVSSTDKGMTVDVVRGPVQDGSVSVSPNVFSPTSMSRSSAEERLEEGEESDPFAPLLEDTEDPELQEEGEQNKKKRANQGKKKTEKEKKVEEPNKRTPSSIASNATMNELLDELEYEEFFDHLQLSYDRKKGDSASFTKESQELAESGSPDDNSVTIIHPSQGYLSNVKYREPELMSKKPSREIELDNSVPVDNCHIGLSYSTNSMKHNGESDEAHNPLW